MNLLASYKLFTFPLPFPYNTFYQMLGIFPEATISEIRETKRDFISDLNKKKRILEKDLEKTSEKTPLLKKITNDIQSLQNQQNELSINKISELEKQYRQIELEIIRIRKLRKWRRIQCSNF